VQLVPQDGELGPRVSQGDRVRELPQAARLRARARERLDLSALSRPARAASVAERGPPGLHSVSPGPAAQPGRGEGRVRKVSRDGAREGQRWPWALHAMPRAALGLASDRLQQLSQRRTPHGAARPPGLLELSRAPFWRDAEGMPFVSCDGSQDSARTDREWLPLVSSSARAERTERPGWRRDAARLHVVSQGRVASRPTRRNEAPDVHDLSLGTSSRARNDASGLLVVPQEQGKPFPERADLLELPPLHEHSLTSVRGTRA
jgi:hypothetical protein